MILQKKDRRLLQPAIHINPKNNRRKPTRSRYFVNKDLVKKHVFLEYEGLRVVRADRLNLELQEFREIVGRGRNAGSRRKDWEFVGYYGNLRQALIGFLDKLVSRPHPGPKDVHSVGHRLEKTFEDFEDYLDDALPKAMEKFQDGRVET